ncbi:MAG: site-2 protease family protein [Spirochaetia bacterium]
MASFLQQLIFYVPLILIAVVFHELAHALVATWLGDFSAKDDGRLTFNPLKHFDTNSLLFLLISGMIGGLFVVARPVSVDSGRFRFPVLGEILVAMAGPFINLIFALIFWPFVLWSAQWISGWGWFYHIIMTYSLIGIRINLFIALFNLIPIPPLDGGYLWLSFLRGPGFERFRSSIAMYGIFFILFIFVTLLIIPNAIVSYFSIYTEYWVQQIVRWWGIF